MAVLSFVLLGLFFASAAFAETNGQEQATSDIVRTSSQALTTMIQGRVATIAAPRPGGLQQTANKKIDKNGNFAFSMNADELGLSSGEDGNSIGIWGMGSLMHFEGSSTGAKYDAEAYNLMVGLDYRATPDLLVGLAAGYGILDLDKKDWNGGADTGTLKTDHEWTVMPYLAYNFTDYTILDAAFAYTDSRYKDDDGTNVGRYDSSRYLTNLGISQYYAIDNWMLSGRLGYMYVHGDLSSYSRGGTNIANPDSYLGQLNAEAKASYFFESGIEPYAALRYFYDTSTSATPVDSDYDEFEGLMGLNWYATDQWIVNFETGASLGRQKFEAYRGQVNIRYEY
ncbi:MULTISPECIES: autotransporter outer membrane beta-barrel domain-containing protein [unclassified Pseudodesulfovibrio]|uniref:autotransporter outer membrane beta-barrel domain-containing protein n=1 Tax=unclassified Pseudodesulfovibrio TaxID=2661612 RepID=UPI001F501FF0|nr:MULTISPECIES: autotransporter outer membrane beta-barrel domain-containing protein [unclassified Pseudodesulfovibrio]MCJ2164997.1 autotransporter outer membrane beta-barrel domain-containing protein [Pseudodesulfovibrio sp. S3-i]